VLLDVLSLVPSQLPLPLLLLLPPLPRLPQVDLSLLSLSPPSSSFWLLSSDLGSDKINLF
jgi:hypothetical protein